MANVGVHAAVVIVGAVLVDAAFGEVPNRVHPVVGMGWLTRRALAFRPRSSQAREFLFGVGLVVSVVGVCAIAAWFCERALGVLAARVAEWVPAPLGTFARAVVVVGGESIALSTVFAGRGLLEAGKRMRLALDGSSEDALARGRAALGHLCSRDASQLERNELCGATVESLAENASDSFVAPLFWFAVATLFGGYGLLAAAAYRAINTLDAMIGYRGRYEYVGKFAARLDDVVNWVPARLTALTLLVASVLCRLRVSQAWHVAWTQHGVTESPNAGWPMALAAGALGVELVKRDCYVLGKGLAAPGVPTIAACERLVGVGFVVFTLVASGLVLGGARG